MEDFSNLTLWSNTTHSLLWFQLLFIIWNSLIFSKLGIHLTIFQRGRSAFLCVAFLNFSSATWSRMNSGCSLILVINFKRSHINIRLSMAYQTRLEIHLQLSFINCTLLHRVNESLTLFLQQYAWRFRMDI